MVQETRNELGVSAVKIHIETTLRKHELCMRRSEAAQGCVDVSQVICAFDQWWSGGAFLRCGTGLCFLGCRGMWRWRAEPCLWLRPLSTSRVWLYRAKQDHEWGIQRNWSSSMQMQPSSYSRVNQLQAGEILSCCGTFPGANKNLK